MMDGVMLSGAERSLDLLLSRASNGALRDPAPGGRALELIVEAGLRAPDHGKLRPWRFVAIRGKARARFAEVCVSALRARDPDATEAEADRMRGKLTAPPLVLALGVHVTPAHKVPEVEQVMSVAAAAMNMLNAAHALGFAGKWITGPNAYDPAVAEALGFAAPDHLAGFLYLGTVAEPPFAGPRPAVGEHFVEWCG